MMEPEHEGHKIDAYIAVAPLGQCIPSTIRSTADGSWAALSNSITEPDRLHAVGWRVHRLECTVKEVAE